MYVRQPFLPPVVRLVPGVQTVPPAQLLHDDVPVPGVSGQEVVFVLSVAGEGRLTPMKRFLENYEKNVLSQLQPARLVMVVWQDGLVEQVARDRLEELEVKYPGYRFTLEVVKEEGGGGGFSRSVGLMTGAGLCRDDELLLLLDVDMEVGTETVNNVRFIVKKGDTVYFPIVFSEFRDGGGYWRDFGYGIGETLVA